MKKFTLSTMLLSLALTNAIFSMEPPKGTEIEGMEFTFIGEAKPEKKAPIKIITTKAEWEKEGVEDLSKIRVIVPSEKTKEIVRRGINRRDKFIDTLKKLKTGKKAQITVGKNFYTLQIRKSKDVSDKLDQVIEMLLQNSRLTSFQLERIKPIIAKLNINKKAATILKNFINFEIERSRTF